MKIMILGDVYSIHTRRWAGHLARNHDVLMAYLPRTSVEDVAGLFSGGLPQRVKLVPLGTHLGINLLRIFRYASMKTFNFKFVHSLGLAKLNRAINEHSPDLLHAHYLPDYGWLASQTGFHPLVLSMWGQNILFVERDGKHELAKEMFAKADSVMCGDYQARDRLVEYGCKQAIIYIQAWGVDVVRFSPQARSEALRNDLLNGHKGIIITIVARLVKEWDVTTLLRAVPLVHRNISNVKFLIIGNGTEQKVLKKQSQELGIEKLVIFTGSVKSEDMPTYLASSDIFIDTYYTDKAGGGIGVAAMEAMSSECSMVVARRPGVEAGVTDGVNGCHFKGGDHVDLANKITMLATNDKLRHSFGKQGRCLALRVGDWDKNMADVEKLYAVVVKARK